VENRFEKLRELHGQPSERATTKVLNYMSSAVIEFIEKSPFLVMASSDKHGNCDASPRGGLPGFVKIIDDKTLLIPDIKGNRLFHSYQNISENDKAGLIFMIPGNDKTVRVNGSVEIIQKDTIFKLLETVEVKKTDKDAILIQGLLLKVDEAYPHCPRAFTFSDLWNTEVIETNKSLLK